MNVQEKVEKKKVKQSMASLKGARTGGKRGQEFMKQPEKDT